MIVNLMKLCILIWIYQIFKFTFYSVNNLKGYKAPWGFFAKKNQPLVRIQSKDCLGVADTVN